MHGGDGDFQLGILPLVLCEILCVLCGYFYHEGHKETGIKLSGEHLTVAHPA